MAVVEHVHVLVVEVGVGEGELPEIFCEWVVVAAEDELPERFYELVVVVAAMQACGGETWLGAETEGEGAIS